MPLPIPRVKLLGWGLFEILASSEETQMDLNISLLDAAVNQLTRIGVKNWTVQAKDFFGTGNFGGQLIWVPSAAAGIGHWLVGAASSIPNTSTYRFPQGMRSAPLFNTQTSVLDFNGGFATNGDGSLVVVAGDSAGGYATAVSADGGATFGTESASQGTSNVVFSPVSHRFVMAGPTSGHVVTSVDGTTWVDSGPISGMTSAVGELTVGNGLLIVSGGGKFAVSTDGGLTFSAAASFPGGSGGVFRAPYTSTYGWMVSTGLSDITTTKDFVTFTHFTLASPLATAGFNSLASDGVSRYAAAYRVAGAYPGPGVVFSDDGGASWTHVRFSSVAETDYLPDQIAHDGHSQWALFSSPLSSTDDTYSFATSIGL